MYDDIVEFMKAYENLDYTAIKTSLRTKRKELGLTPRFFEVKAGIPASQYGQFEKLSYKYKPSIETLIKICNAMDISILELLNDEPKEHKIIRRKKKHE